MKRRVLGALVALLGCSSHPPAPTAAPSSPASPWSTSPSQNERLYAEGSALEKEGRWEEAANVYQRYVLAMGDALSYMDRSSMELRIKQLRERASVTSPRPE